MALAALSLFVLPALGVAQERTDPLDRQEQLRQAEQIQRQREQAQGAPFAGERTRAGDAALAGTALPEETPCFPIQHVHLTGGGRDAARFSWLWKRLRRYEGRCIGRQGIDLIRRRALDMMVARGLVTSRIGVPAQDLSTGHLAFELLPGRLREVRVESADGPVSWRNALPLRRGGLLDLRAIEQAVEQLKRVPSQDAKIDIAPGEAPGESDLIVTMQHARPWRAVLSADDSGVRATGRVQGGADVSWDSPLGINDLLNVGYNHDLASHDSQRGTRGNSLGYSVPWGWWTFALSASSYRYHQQVQGYLQDFDSSGQSSSLQLDLQRVVHRGARSKTSAGLVVARRRARSYLDEVEIAIQRRDTTSAELYLSHRQYLGNAQVDLRLGHRRGVPWFNGQWTGYDPAVGFPGYRYGVTTLDVNLALPFQLGAMALQWDSSLHAQTSPDLLLGSEFITVGGRYSVRGFDGESTLGGERGAYWRNAVGWQTHWGLSPYLGVDAGRISGPSTEGLDGRSLIGGFVGMRGGWGGVNVDAFAGWSIHQPRGFQSEQPAFGFRLIYQF